MGTRKKSSYGGHRILLVQKVAVGAEAPEGVEQGWEKTFLNFIRLEFGGVSFAADVLDTQTVVEKGYVPSRAVLACRFPRVNRQDGTVRREKSFKAREEAFHARIGLDFDEMNAVQQWGRLGIEEEFRDTSAMIAIFGDIALAVLKTKERWSAGTLMA